MPPAVVPPAQEIPHQMPPVKRSRKEDKGPKVTAEPFAPSPVLSAAPVAPFEPSDTASANAPASSAAVSADLQVYVAANIQAADQHIQDFKAAVNQMPPTNEHDDDVEMKDAETNNKRDRDYAFGTTGEYSAICIL
jgi:hypothetical protein